MRRVEPVGRVLAALLAAVFVVQSGAIHSEGTSMSTGAELSGGHLHSAAVGGCFSK